MSTLIRDRYIAMKIKLIMILLAAVVATDGSNANEERRRAAEARGAIQTPNAQLNIYNFTIGKLRITHVEQVLLLLYLKKEGLLGEFELGRPEKRRSSVLLHLVKGMETWQVEVFCTFAEKWKLSEMPLNQFLATLEPGAGAQAYEPEPFIPEPNRPQADPAAEPLHASHEQAPIVVQQSPVGVAMGMIAQYGLPNVARAAYIAVTALNALNGNESAHMPYPRTSSPSDFLDDMRNAPDGFAQIFERSMETFTGRCIPPPTPLS
ncbi:MAG: hypothetical protein LBJ42_00605 [Holosporales bacterium]|nr:hypothetical protein [Holosporales bacterium]